MTVAITNYTNSDAVRGAVGLTDNEVTDPMLEDQNLASALLLDLEDWLPTHKDIYEAGRVNSPTAAAKKQYDILKLYSMWYCACRMTRTMALAMPEKISDGKAEMKRFNETDLKGIAEEACSMSSLYKTQLQEDLGETVDSTGYSPMGVASPDYDPVTNEGA